MEVIEIVLWLAVGMVATLVLLLLRSRSLYLRAHQLHRQAVMTSWSSLVRLLATESSQVQSPLWRLLETQAQTSVTSMREVEARLSEINTRLSRFGIPSKSPTVTCSTLQTILTAVGSSELSLGTKMALLRSAYL